MTMWHCVLYTVQVKEDGSYEVLWKEKDVIGACISTKAIGSNRRKDVTNHYKYKERKQVHLYAYYCQNDCLPYDYKGQQDDVALHNISSFIKFCTF